MPFMKALVYFVLSSVAAVSGAELPTPQLWPPVQQSSIGQGVASFTYNVKAISGPILLA